MTESKPASPVPNPSSSAATASSTSASSEKEEVDAPQQQPEKPPPEKRVISMQEHLTEQFGSSFLDPDMEVSERLERARKLSPFLEEIDGYWSFSSEETGGRRRSKKKKRRSSDSVHLPGPTEGRLPPLDWNNNFRKSYTLLLWVRPRISAFTKDTTVAEDDSFRAAGNGNGGGGNLRGKRLLYRFGDSDDDATCTTGVAVSVGEWRAIEDHDDDDDDDGGGDNYDSNDNDDGDNDDENNNNDGAKRRGMSPSKRSPTRPPRTKKAASRSPTRPRGNTTNTNTNTRKRHRKLIASLTAYSLPYEPPPEDAGSMMLDGSYDPAPFVTAPLELTENEWSMIGITHVFPYLKRPHWSICVNGKTMAGGELAYPQVQYKNSQRGGSNRRRRRPTKVGGEPDRSGKGSVWSNTLFREIVDGGCEIIKTRSNDCRKKASELQETVLGTANPRHRLSLHLASFLLANEAFSPTVQALLAQAGPTMSLQASGGMPQLPPVANWSKGSSLEGPNVGIPLVVHGQGLRVQQLSASCVVWGSAIDSKITYRYSNESSDDDYDDHDDPSRNIAGAVPPKPVQEIVCRMTRPRGSTHGAPRVGLIQPTPPEQDPGSGIPEDDSNPVSLTIVGSKCSIHHTLFSYLIDVEREMDKQTDGNTAIDERELHGSTTKLFSLLAFQGLALDCTTTLPFFLGLPPPGTKLDLQLGSLTDSLRHLFALYSHRAVYAAQLLALLTRSVRNGGGRWHEELLQNGTIHVLSSALRQSLVRAEFLGVGRFQTYGEFVKAAASKQKNSSSNPMTTTMDQLPVGPTRIPRTIVAQLVELVDACCGPPADFVEDLDPADQIQRTSDLALTTVFGMALDCDLWGNDVRGIADVFEALAQRYGGICITSGYILRSQISVQYFLDILRYKLGSGTAKKPDATHQDCLRRIGKAAGDMLLAMLLSSLSNSRSISQGEHDIAACMGVLSDSCLGSLCAHVVFRSLVGVLEWCEIVPPGFADDATASEAYPDASSSEGGGGIPRRERLGSSSRSASSGSSSSGKGGGGRGGPKINDDHKCQVASRLARNLMMAQFHDVIAPMLLSRTVFSAERTYTASSIDNKAGNKLHDLGGSSTHTYNNSSGHRRRLPSGSFHNGDSSRRSRTVGGDIGDSSRRSRTVGGDIGGNGEVHLPLSWQEDWRLGLMVFVWVSSIAGAEGVTSSKSMGSLLLASGLAGSLQGVLEFAGSLYAGNLFLPDPSMALTVASTLRSDGWSYTDLLQDRLTIVMPVFPALIVSLLQQAPASSNNEASSSSSTDNGGGAIPSRHSLRVLTELVTAVGGSFYRVFGGLAQTKNSKTRDNMLETRTAKAYAPQLLAATMMLEHHIVPLRAAASEPKKDDDDDGAVTVLRDPAPVSNGGTDDDGTWVEVSASAVGGSFLTGGAVRMPENATAGSVLVSCQNGMLTTIAELLCNAMKAGGGEASTLLWRSVLGTLREVDAYKLGGDRRENSSSSSSSSSKNRYDSATKNVLCRLLAGVLMKCLQRDSPWDLWPLPLSLALSRLCLLVEEKELLRFPTMGTVDRRYSPDQILLLCALLHVLRYGRDTTGWCQLILPVPPGSAEGDLSSSGRGSSIEPPATAAKIMLPILQPALRIAMDCVGNVSSDVRIVVPSASAFGRPAEPPDFDESGGDAADANRAFLLEHLTEELRQSLTAAIVGQAFATARDIALYAMASLRNNTRTFEATGDDRAAGWCAGLIRLTAEEIRVRYEGERRRRETALIDAYDDAIDESQRSGSFEDSKAVESLIIGDGIVPESPSAAGAADSDESEGGGDDNKDAPPPRPKTPEDRVPADFLLLNQGVPPGAGSSAAFKAKMEWSKYEGLSAALERCVVASEGKPIDHGDGDHPRESADTVLEALSPFLDAWDEHAAIDAVDTELVKLFDLTMSASSPDGLRDGVVAENDDDDVALRGDPEGIIPELDVFRLRGSETAADAMTTFIEMAAAEKTRTQEVTTIFLPNHRNSCAAFTERFCWAKHMELLKKGKVDDLWERGIADGNRDVRSRLISLPCRPNFKRFIPRYLDHGSSSKKAERRSSTSSVTSMDSNKDGEALKEIDAFTRLLIQSGQLEIVDITKKEINEEENPALEIPNLDTLDDDFEEKPLEIGQSRSDDSDTMKRIDEDEDPGQATTKSFASVSDDLFSTDDDDDISIEDFDKKHDATHVQITASAFASPPDNSSSTLGLMHSAAAGLIERHLDNCLHVKTEGSRKCSMLLTGTHLILEYEVESEGLYEGELMAVREAAERERMVEETKGNHIDEEKIKEDLEKRQKMVASMRPKSIRWNLSELSHVYLRRYRLRDSSIELFFIPSGGTSFGGYGLFSPSTSLFLDFGPGHQGKLRRDDAAFAIMKRAPPQAIKQWPDRDAQFLHEQLSRLTIGWVEGRITNFDYLLHLNMLAGRSYNDTCQYPIMPWVLSNYHSEEIPDLTDPENFRDLSKPMGALNPDRLEDFIERFNTFADPSIPPFMYGSHYSTNAGVVLHFLVRLHPFAGLHRQLQGGNFDVADRLFASVPRTWEMCTGCSAAEVKELTPEWYCNPSFLKNENKFKLGTSQDGEVIGDVVLPPWAKGSAETFVEVMRNALESDVCSATLPDWIDLIFGRKQQGPEAIAAHNVFFYLTYYGSVDVAAIEDEGLRQATELQIAHFGQCPMQLFVRPHVRRVQYVNKKRLSFYQITSAYTFGIENKKTEASEVEKSLALSSPSKMLSRGTDKQVIFGPPLYLPFFSAPLSHWVQLDSPPPGPHAPLIGVRLAGVDRCLAVDARGVFHCFRWEWKATESTEIPGFGSSSATTFPLDNGCFVAQRELARFKTVPRLVHTPPQGKTPAVAISKTLFAGRSILVVLSDGDGRGGLALQLVDPAKGLVRGEALIRSIHSSRIHCIATDPIGTAAGHGGVGGELAIVGSFDGTASIWRFMSSHYLPLRPRVRLSGHASSPIYAVGLNASIHVAVTVSKHRLCIHSIGNGNVIRMIEPPENGLGLSEDIESTTTFADSRAVAISVQGFVVAVCETRVKGSRRGVITLNLFSLEGVSLGSKALDQWRGVPGKFFPTPDGTTILVCHGRGVTLHRLSAITPLEYIDEWQITESDDVLDARDPDTVSRSFDIDLGPSLNRPVVAAAACSNGVLRLHALPGISAFSERHKKTGLSHSVGSLISAPAMRFKAAFGRASSTVVGSKKDLPSEMLVSSSLHESTRNQQKTGGIVGGFLGGMFGKKK